MMRIICAWCNTYMGEKEGVGKQGISHGICEQCLSDSLRKLDKQHQDEANNTNEMAIGKITKLVLQ